MISLPKQQPAILNHFIALESPFESDAREASDSGHDRCFPAGGGIPCFPGIPLGPPVRAHRPGIRSVTSSKSPILLRISFIWKQKKL